MQIEVDEIKRVRVATVIEVGDLVSVNEAARHAGILPSTVSRMIDRGDLPDYSRAGDIRGTRYTSRNAILQFVQSKNKWNGSFKDGSTNL